MKILHVVGARPNFMKAAPVIFALRDGTTVSQALVHTGQHYDRNMSAVFFDELGIPEPDFNLGVGSGSQAAQTAEVMIRIEKVFAATDPDLVLVYGDVNSTVAAGLVAVKLGIRLGHIEAGLRSGDLSMPEEINRLVTDQISDLHFTPSADADENLIREGVAKDRIHCVGNCMIDTVVRLLGRAKRPLIDNFALDQPFVLVTLHRPSNVDDPDMLRKLMVALSQICEQLPVVFPIHPRTRHRLETLSIHAQNEGRMALVEPLGYLEFLWLQRHAKLVLTDSGGIQEETTYLQVPCLTLRENTERPITVEQGTNILVGQDMARLLDEVNRILNGHKKEGVVPPLWDGHAGERIAQIVACG